MKQLFLLIESCSAFASVQPRCVSVPLELGGSGGKGTSGLGCVQESKGHCRGEL